MTTPLDIQITRQHRLGLAYVFGKSEKAQCWMLDNMIVSKDFIEDCTVIIQYEEINSVRVLMEQDGLTVEVV